MSDETSETSSGDMMVVGGRRFNGRRQLSLLCRSSHEEATRELGFEIVVS